MTSTESVDILVVEDNESQRSSIVEILHAVLPEICINAVQDGAEAMDFLLGRGASKSRAGGIPPRLIMMDLYMPGEDGCSVLGQIRSLSATDALTRTPVVMFTDSKAVTDVERCYRGGANSYIIKPFSYPDFQTIVGKIGQYWMKLNRTL